MPPRRGGGTIAGMNRGGAGHIEPSANSRPTEETTRKVARPLYSPKRYTLLCRRIAPPREKSEVAEGGGHIEFADDRVIVRIKHLSEGLLCFVATIATVATVLAVLPWGWPFARYFGLTWPVWVFVVIAILWKRKVFELYPKNGRTYCMRRPSRLGFSTRFIICLELPAGTWLGVDVGARSDRRTVLRKLQECYGERMYIEPGAEP